ncbi:MULTISPECIES: hypothetical protein [Pseudomonas]|uniref:hypothetical protein n=1 Tax=Pseudomonas TaxID=286 RepID=UPI0018AAEFEF|nr:hypothetical protein [Pseudomonas guariconensis]MBF8732103.1 hypothetical protein [Pseudomonas guariconensis]
MFKALRGVDTHVKAAAVPARPSMLLGFPLQCVTVPTIASESSAEVLHGYH